VCNKFGDIKWNTCCEVQRWAHENGCPWHSITRDWAAAELRYTDDFGNLHAEESDDEYSDEYSDDE